MSVDLNFYFISTRSCPYYYFVLKAHHHRLIFHCFYPVIAQCLPHKTHLVYNSFLIQTLCALCCPQPSTLVFTGCLNFCIIIPFGMEHQLFSHHPSILINAQFLHVPWIQPSAHRLISAFKQKRTKQRSGDPGSRPGSYMTQQFVCISYLLLLTTVP